MDAPLLEALGGPPAGGLVPRAADPGWRYARTQLRRALRALGCCMPVRTTRVLWQLCHTGNPPACMGWGQLCEGLAVRDA
eukprot:6291133-Alexandrium_andersonii.AAC.1